MSTDLKNVIYNNFVRYVGIGYPIFYFVLFFFILLLICVWSKSIVGFYRFFICSILFIFFLSFYELIIKLNYVTITKINLIYIFIIFSLILLCKFKISGNYTNHKIIYKYATFIKW